MTAITTKIGTVIPAADVYKYDRCIEEHAGHGLPPCQECRIEVRTVCKRIEAIRKNSSYEIIPTPTKPEKEHDEEERVFKG